MVSGTLLMMARYLLISEITEMYMVLLFVPLLVQPWFGTF